MGGDSASCWHVLLGVFIVLVLLVIYRVWKVWRLGPPADCKKYSDGALRLACDAGVDVCKKLDGRDAKACNAAVGACMPVLQAAYSDHSFNQVASLIPACAEAGAKISPKGAAEATEDLAKELGTTVSLPADIAPIFKDPETRRHVQRIADMTPGAVWWLLRYGQHLPVSNGHKSGFSGPKFYPSSTAGGFASSCAPLCPKPECYSDMGCEPQGYCQAYFADDPTYGGRCVPA